jgi:hypothetical protein
VGVEKQKGFRVEYCHVNDEYVAVVKDTVFMGVGNTIQEAVDELQADINRGDQEDQSDSTPAGDSDAAMDFSKLDHFSFGGDEDPEEDDLSEETTDSDEKS